jgi:FtsP/CotA-like multicopper oxidase with cupredoxin domain
MRKLSFGLALILPFLLHPAAAARAAEAPAKISCARPAPGSLVQPAPDLYSANGVLNVELDYYTSVDANNLTLFCYVTPDGLESPTLHVNPGDTLNIKLKNRTPKLKQDARLEPMVEPLKYCGAKTMLPGSINIHFHGLNVAPTCHSDEVVRTMVNPGETFTYSIAIPADEPPGMYWYHAHIHGYSDADVLGGASGAIEVEGIQNVQPKVAGLTSRILIMRDQPVVAQQIANAGIGKPGTPKTPSWDISLNYVPVQYPALVPAVMQVPAGQSEFWRVVNASSDTIDDLVLKYDGKPQQVQIVALDGVATGSQDGTRRGKLMPVSDVFIPPSGRAEFIIPPIPAGTKHVTLETLRIDTGPKGDTDTGRIVAMIQPQDAATAGMGAAMAMPAVTGPAGPQRFANLDDAPVTTVRHLFFSEIFPDPQDPNEGVFYITVAGHVPQVFDPNAPPAITTTQGAVEDWVIENQTNEVHEFHIHQIHFQVRQINGVNVPVTQRQFRDTFQVPYWSGKGPYPSVRLRMDFRGAVVGDFVYHCHILDHEDAGMMAVIRVKAPGG